MANQVNMEEFIKIKFSYDDNLPLNKTLKLHKMIIIIRSDGKFYQQVLLDKCLYDS